MIRIRKLIRRTAIGLAAVLLLLLTVSLVVTGFGITISAAPWRARIAQAASDALGREVALEGPLALVPTVRPTLTVGGIHIGNPPGFLHPELAHLGRARLRVELLPLLQGEVRVVEINAEDLRVRLEQRDDGRANWQFDLPKGEAPKQRRTQEVPTKQIKLTQIDRVAFQHIDLEYVAGGRSRYFALDELVGEGGRGRPLRITMRGAVEKSFPYTVSINCGSLLALYDADKPWPIELQLDFAGTSLRIEGSVTRIMSAPAANLVFALGSDNLSELERLLQTKFPPVGTAALSARVRWERSRLHISGLHGSLGESVLDGELELELTGNKPRVRGELSMAVLDLRPFLGSETRAEKPAPPSAPIDPQKALAELEQQSFSLKQLELVDADLTLHVDRWIGVPGDVRDSQLQVVLQDGVLKAPLRATVADVPLSGELDVSAAQDVPQFLLWLGTERSRLGRMAELFAGVRGVEGTLARLKLTLKGAGDRLASVVRALQVHLELTNGHLTYGNVAGGRPVEFRIDTLDVALPAGQRLRGRVLGSLLGEPFRAEFKGGDLPTLTREIRWPLELDLAATGATLHVEGILAAPQAESGAEVSFRLAAQRAGDVARWLGLSPTAAGAIEIQGHAVAESDEWRLSPFTARLGNTVLRADLARIGIDHHPLVKVKLAVDMLDLDELEHMLPPPQPKAAKTSMVELPILPTGISLFDADVDVQVKRVQMQPAPVTDVSFAGHIREGHMEASPFSASVGGVVFSGATALDLRSEVPEASVWVAAQKVDVGALLRQLHVVRELDARVESLSVAVIGRGSRLGEMLQRSSLQAELGSGQLTLSDPNGSTKLGIQLTKGVAQAAPAQPVSVDLDGLIDTTPVTIRIATGMLPDFLKATGRVPFALAAEAAGAHLELTGKATLPFSQREAELELTVRGQRFDSLNTLARVELPPWGPWKFGGRFRASGGGYEVPDLTVRVGDSSLVGRGSWTTAGVRPRLDIMLSAPRIQLDDFKLAGWSLVEKKPTKPEKPMSADELRAKAKAAAAQGQKLLSPEVLRRLDASLQVQVGEVLSGADRLGSGELRAQLADGRLAIEPAEVHVPGGSARIGLSYEPIEGTIRVGANIDVSRFDYGILARRIKPDTDMQGWFSLKMTIESQAPSLDAVMQHANGRIDFEVWPHNLKAGIFDLWAVNLFLALLPAVDSSSESKVNCAIGRFNLRSGKLTQDQILLDTSRMRVRGKGSVDFDSEALYFRLVPTAKTPQFFSLATPIEVNGTITDFHVGVSSSDVLETTARLFTSVIVVPLQKLTSRSVPRDGSDVCGAAHSPGS